MRTKSVMLGAALTALSLVAVALPAANAKPGVEIGTPGHEAAIEASRRSIPLSPSS